MRIGILTYHRAHNYGAVLQCYALQQVLTDMGHEVNVIDYRQPYIENKYKSRIDFRRLVSCLIRLNISGAIFLIEKYLNSFTLRRNFNNFVDKFLNCSEPVGRNNIPDDYDCYVIGSDQMWGLHCTGGDEPVYWGSFRRKPGSKLIGYAISSNKDYSKYLSLFEIADRVSKFDALSFREISVCEEIQAVSRKQVKVCLDPTLLTTASMWNPLINDSYKKRQYVATYFIRESHEVRKGLIEKAKAFASLRHLELIDLSAMKYPVEDFISIIKCAQFVFTTSFHATVFSLLFGIPFTSICLCDGHDDRYVNLLNTLGLSNHLSKVNDGFIQPDIINVQEVNEKIKYLRQSSCQFLLTNI